MKPISLILTIAAATLAAGPDLRAEGTLAAGQPQAPAAAPNPALQTPSPAPDASKPAPPPKSGTRNPRGAGNRGQSRKQLDKDGDGVVSPEERKAAGENARKKLLERFDQDGDGQISAAERQALEADREAKMLARFDADGDGKLSPAERQAARQGQPGQAPPAAVPPARGKGDKRPLRLDARPKVLERFDKDGDGQLSDTERAAAREALKGRRKPKTAP